MKRFVIEYANNEKKESKKWMMPENYIVYREYLERIIKDYKRGFYTNRETIQLIFEAFDYLQKEHWKI